MTESTFLRIPLNEWKRKAVHMGAFGFAFLLPYITPQQAALGAIAVFCFNAFLLPKLIPSIMRPDENGKPTGLLEVILYPAAILATIVALSRNVQMVTCDYVKTVCEDQSYPIEHYPLGVLFVWFALAIIDGFLGVTHRLFVRRKRLPWNDRKNWAGLLTGALFCAITAALIMNIDDINSISSGNAVNVLLNLLFLFLIMFGIALWESVWFGISDNLTIAFLVTILIGVNDLTEPISMKLGLWIVVPPLFALVAWFGKKITFGGAILGCLIAASLMYADPRLFLFLLGFFLLGNLATHYGSAAKEALGIAESQNGRRGPAEIFGAAAVAGWVSLLAWQLPRTVGQTEHEIQYLLLIIISPLIAKTMDTVSSEIGKAVGGKTISLMNFKLVPPGTAGAVSLEGMLWGIAAAALLAALIFPLQWGGLTQWSILIGIAVAANLFESYWGAWASPRGLDDGPHTNFLMTLFAAVLAWFVWGR